ncbi:metalloprotease [Thermococcus chitonophagus]|uniref:Metalloprotease n=1 Tax=Thermococcus chitonophagus TaxID=54262 RepID=A0A160VS00_9EURY|nr:site-2 protease family protein [Thermococcus chitonophagus]ASJ15923.1 metalloprotease [Thermococcus chitonophagus]CUX77166.1 serine protease htra related protein [Thermococcus chitonophagus]
MSLVEILLGILGFWAFVTLLGVTVFKESESVEISLFQIIWRTKKFLNFIDRIGRRHERFWRIYGDAGIVVGFIGMGIVLYYLARQAYRILHPQGPVAPGAQLVIPGVTIPLVYGLIALAVLLVVHELSHGFVARAEKIPLKSVGIVLFFVIPGAFVEPDEEALNKAPLRSRLRVFGAGSLANIIVALIALLIINGIGLAFEPAGVEVNGVIKGSPADGVLQPGDVIIGINGQNFTTIEEFIKIMNTTRPNQTITMTIVRDGEIKTVKITLGEHPERPGKGFIGIYPTQYLKSKIGFTRALMDLFFTFYWIYVLNVGIGLMNLLPLYPLDGGRMLMDTLTEKFPRIGRPIGYSVAILSLILLIINIIPSIRGLIG